MHRPHLLWFDMTLATQHAEVDRLFDKHFDVQHCSDVQHPEEQHDLNRKVALCFDFDYPDRPGLDLMCLTKKKFPHLPVLMITAQHSERLAVWAYRNRVFDYLVKPIVDEDLRRCLKLLSDVQFSEAPQNRRKLYDFRLTMPTEIPPGQRSFDVRLAPAVRYVEKNFRGRIRNSDVAELCDMSPFHFSHEFTETFSLTFQDFVIRYRILQACKELRHPRASVANVAYSVGFNDPSYFSRVFRRYIGVSPSEFCEQVSGGEADRREADIIEKLDLPDLDAVRCERRRQDRRTFGDERRQESAS